MSQSKTQTQAQCVKVKLYISLIKASAKICTTGSVCFPNTETSFKCINIKTSFKCMNRRQHDLDQMRVVQKKLSLNLKCIFVFAALHIPHLAGGETFLFHKSLWRKKLSLDGPKAWFNFSKAIMHHYLLNLFVSHVKMKEGDVLVRNLKQIVLELKSIKEISAGYAQEDELSAFVETVFLDREW